MRPDTIRAPRAAPTSGRYGLSSWSCARWQERGPGAAQHAVVRCGPGIVSVRGGPDQRCSAKLPFALRRIRDTWLGATPLDQILVHDHQLPALDQRAADFLVRLCVDE